MIQREQYERFITPVRFGAVTRMNSMLLLYTLRTRTVTRVRFGARDQGSTSGCVVASKNAAAVAT